MHITYLKKPYMEQHGIGGYRMVINKTKNTEVLSLLYPLTDTLNSRANNEKT